MAFWIVSGCVLLPFLFFFLLGYFAFRGTVCRRKRYPADRRAFGGGSTLPPNGLRILNESRAWFDAQDLENVSVTSCDGLILRGKLLATDGEAKGTVILFHGYHSSCRRDLSVQSMLLHKAGYHLILVSQRSHGDSEGVYICFGVKERLDVRPWCALSIRRFGEELPIYLFGLSMGASTVLMSANTGLPSQVRGIVGDCGFSSPFDIIRYNLWHKHKLPPVPTVHFMNWWSRLLADFDFCQASCREALENSELPVLILHGEEDLFVPTQMSRDLAAALPRRAELVIFPHARHGQSVYYDAEKYEQTILSFLERTKK